MRPLSTFALEIQRGEDHEPSRVSVVLSTAPDAAGVLRLSPQCITLGGGGSGGLAWMTRPHSYPSRLTAPRVLSE